jgi:hypothetical protein
MPALHPDLFGWVCTAGHMRSTKVMQGIKSRLLRVALSTRLAAPDYGHTCSIDPITASSFSFSRKSRSSYPYKLSKPVFGPRPDYNLRVSRQISRVDALKTETHLSVSSRRQDWLRD